MRGKRRYITLVVPVFIIEILNEVERYMGFPLGTIYSKAVLMLYNHFQQGKITENDLINMFAESRDDFRGKRWMDAELGHPTFELSFSVAEEIWQKEQELMNVVKVEQGERTAFRYMVFRYFIKGNRDLMLLVSMIEAYNMQIHPLMKKYTL